MEATGDFTPDRDRVADADATIPVIDISGFDRGDRAAREQVVDAVGRACARVGFLVITGHGVSDTVIDAIFKNGRAFFARPTEEKLRIKRPGPGISRGYNSLAGQSLGLTMGKAAPPDLMESLGFGPLEIGDGPYWREGYGPTHFHPKSVSGRHARLSRLGHRLLAGDGATGDAADAHLCARPRC